MLSITSTFYLLVSNYSHLELSYPTFIIFSSCRSLHTICLYEMDPIIYGILTYNQLLMLLYTNYSQLPDSNYCLKTTFLLIIYEKFSSLTIILTQHVKKSLVKQTKLEKILSLYQLQLFSISQLLFLLKHAGITPHFTLKFVNFTFQLFIY